MIRKSFTVGLGATHVVLSGAATNWCSRSTAYAALERGYDLTLISDGHTTDTLELSDGALIKASDVVRDLNVTMAWASYPGRSNSVATSAELSFRQGS